MTPFDPRPHLTSVRGKAYLEVKWRLVWLRSEHPDAQITTELLHYEPDQGIAVVSAQVAIPGGGSATGIGSESAQDWADYAEKAETKAIGRALAALGYGTQFCADFDEGAADGRVVDAPVAPPAPAPAPAPGASARGGAPLPPTEAQLKLLTARARRAGLDEAALDALARAEFGVDVDGLTRRQASQLIDRLGAEGAAPAPATGGRP